MCSSFQTKTAEAEKLGKSRRGIVATRTMERITAIKPGPKPKREDGKPDERRRVTPDNRPKHPKLKPHEHKPGD